MNESRRIEFPILLSLLLVLGVVGAVPRAEASLVGTDVSVSVIEFQNPILTPYFADTVTVVDPGIEVSNLFNSFNVDIGPQSIRLDILSTGAIGAADFFGFQFENLSWGSMSGEITGFAAADSNIVGIDLSRLLFTADAVAFNLQGLSLNRGDFIDVTLAVRLVPAPPAVGLLMGGLGLLGWVSMRRHRRHTPLGPE